MSSQNFYSSLPEIFQRAFAYELYKARLERYAIQVKEVDGGDAGEET